MPKEHAEPVGNSGDKHCNKMQSVWALHATRDYIMINKIAKTLMCALALLMILILTASSQEVVIPSFPLGVAGSIEPDFFKQYQSQLQAVADTLIAYPKAKAIIIGGADGIPYWQNHDALNPGLALGRALVLRNILVNEFKVDSSQVVIWTEDSKEYGPEHRFTSVRVDRELADIDRRLTELENRPPVERVVSEVSGVPRDSVMHTEVIENLGLQFAVGISSSAYGPIPAGSIVIFWKKSIYVEGLFGHTFWNEDYNFGGTILDIKRRIIGGQVIVYPDPDVPVGIVGGWIRSEEIAQRFYEYVRLSEGLTLGLRAELLDFVQITGTYNPSKRKIVGIIPTELKDDQFMISVMAFKAFGGGK